MYLKMNKKNVDNKLQIYKLNSKDKVLKYYDSWTKKAQFNQDMIDWNYTAPYNATQLLSQYSSKKTFKF